MLRSFESMFNRTPQLDGDVAQHDLKGYHAFFKRVLHTRKDTTSK